MTNQKDSKKMRESNWRIWNKQRKEKSQVPNVIKKTDEPFQLPVLSLFLNCYVASPSVLFPCLFSIDIDSKIDKSNTRECVISANKLCIQFAVLLLRLISGIYYLHRHILHLHFFTSHFRNISTQYFLSSHALFLFNRYSLQMGHNNTGLLMMFFFVDFVAIYLFIISLDDFSHSFFFSFSIKLNNLTFFSSAIFDWYHTI